MKKAPMLMLAIFVGSLLIGCSKGDDTAAATTSAGSTAPVQTKAGGVGTGEVTITEAGKNADKMTGTKAGGK